MGLVWNRYGEVTGTTTGGDYTDYSPAATNAPVSTAAPWTPQLPGAPAPARLTGIWGWVNAPNQTGYTPQFRVLPLPPRFLQQLSEITGTTPEEFMSRYRQHIYNLNSTRPVTFPQGVTPPPVETAAPSGAGINYGPLSLSGMLGAVYQNPTYRQILEMLQTVSAVQR